MADKPDYKHIFVAVHGIGKQNRFETVRSVATRLTDLPLLRAQRGDNTKRIYPVAPQPLGYFHGDVLAQSKAETPEEAKTHSDVRNFTAVSLVDDAGSLEHADLAHYGFAEVFWADIPQEVVKEGRTLEETKAWARTVMARANNLYAHADAMGEGSLVPPDFSLAGEVLDEIITTVYVLENLFFLADKAGIFKFELKAVLEEYLGDVQLVAEFSHYRANIIARFHRAMENICKEHPKAKIHIVAHSEGTVVSFLGLLHALSHQKLVESDAKKDTLAEIITETNNPRWLQQVYGFMTIGSPIDKHILLWQRMWRSLDYEKIRTNQLDHKIKWRNYYDYGDPVGFKLDSARTWLKNIECTAFEFSGAKSAHHDIGFARYLFPGEAHNEYWKDPAVFDHFIRTVVKEEDKVPPPPTRKSIYVLSPSLPYLLSFVILFAGVFLLFKASYNYKHPGFDPLQKVVRFLELGVQPPVEPSPAKRWLAIFGIAGLVAGVTSLGRIPRLAMGKGANYFKPKTHKHKSLKDVVKYTPRFLTNPFWPLVGLLAFLAGCGFYLLVPWEIRHDIGGIFYYLGPHGPTLGIMALAALAGLFGYLANIEKLGARQQRWFCRGSRPLIFCGAVAVVAILTVDFYVKPYISLRVPASELSAFSGNVTNTIKDVRAHLSADDISIAQQARLSTTELNQVIARNGTNWVRPVKEIMPVLATNPPIWPVVVAGLAFLYLWWLAMLIFDLAFVWQRYIRHSVTNDRLHEWRFPKEPKKT